MKFYIITKNGFPLYLFVTINANNFLGNNLIHFFLLAIKAHHTRGRSAFGGKTQKTYLCEKLNHYD